MIGVVADPTFTRCPGCATVFRATAEQLALREGQVRCGHCRAVFDANDHRVEPGGDDPSPAAVAAARSAIAPGGAGDTGPSSAPARVAAHVDEEGAPAAQNPDTAPATSPDDVPDDAPGAPPDEPPVPQKSDRASRDGPEERQAPEAPASGSDTSVDPGAPDDEVALPPALAAQGAPSADADDALPASDAAGTSDGGVAASADPLGADASAAPDTPGAAPQGSDAALHARDAALHGSDAAADASNAAADVAPGQPSRFEWRPRKPLRERPTALYGAAIALLLVALATQAVVEFRSPLAAYAPFTRPLLERGCAVAGCSIEPLRDAAALSIDASDLQADPGHKGLLLLSATIRNRARYPIAFPDLELTLTDAADRVVVRRAFPPRDYIGGTADPAQGIPANGEKLVKLFIDASATSQAGYRIYLFYP